MEARAREGDDRQGTGAAQDIPSGHFCDIIPVIAAQSRFIRAIKGFASCDVSDCKWLRSGTPVRMKN